MHNAQHPPFTTRLIKRARRISLSLHNKREPLCSALIVTLAVSSNQTAVGVPRECRKMTERKVSYFYDADIGNYHYGQGKAVPWLRVDIELSGLGSMRRTITDAHLALS